MEKATRCALPVLSICEVWRLGEARNNQSPFLVFPAVSMYVHFELQENSTCLWRWLFPVAQPSAYSQVLL